MRAELAHLELPTPPYDSGHFSVNVVAYLGSEGGTGADLFDFTVCTPSWLASNVSMPTGFWFVRHHLPVSAWDAGLVRRAIADLCLRTEGKDWQEIATKLSRFGYWEFEDYRE